MDNTSSATASIFVSGPLGSQTQTAPATARKASWIVTETIQPVIVGLGPDEEAAGAVPYERNRLPELRRTAEVERFRCRMIRVELERHHRDDRQIDEPANDHRGCHGDRRPYQLPRQRPLARAFENNPGQEPDHKNRRCIGCDALVDGKGCDIECGCESHMP